MRCSKTKTSKRTLYQFVLRNDSLLTDCMPLWSHLNSAKHKTSVHYCSLSQTSFMWQCERETYSAVSLLGGRSLPGEQDELGAVLLQALHVGLQGFCGSVATAGVNRDADGAGCLFVDAGRLQGGRSTACYSKLNLKPDLDLTSTDLWHSIWFSFLDQQKQSSEKGFKGFIKKIQRFRRFVIIWLLRH